jgi:hypothetical protein
MKKMIFSAIALVAFSATSFAAETKNGVKIAAKTTVVKKQNKKKKAASLVILPVSDCFKKAAGARNLYLNDMGYSLADANIAYYEDLFECLSTATF